MKQEVIGVSMGGAATIVGLAVGLGIIFVLAPEGDMPDQGLTPGSVGSTDTAEVCARYAHTHRPGKEASEALKRIVFERYHLDWSMHSSYENDHRVPLCLGGDSELTNLWPQSWSQAKRKDALEITLCKFVCDGSTSPYGSLMSLDDAQKVFFGDWRKNPRY